MKIEIDRNWGFRIIAEKEDLSDIQRLETLMKSKEWEVLELFQRQMREVILKMIGNVANSQVNERAAWIKSSMFKGFEETVDLPEKILKAGRELQKGDKEDDGKNDEPIYDVAGWVNGAAGDD